MKILKAKYPDNFYAYTENTFFNDGKLFNLKNLNVIGVEDAIKIAIDIYENKKEEYQKMCKNAKELCVDMNENTVDEYAFIIDRVAGLGFFENEIEEKMEQMNWFIVGKGRKK